MFDTAMLNNEIVPNNVTLAIVLNSGGRERYSNWEVTPFAPVGIGNRQLLADRSVKTFQDKHWKSFLSHTDTILPPTMLVTENFLLHRDTSRPNMTVKSLSTFLKECVVRKQNNLPISFDPLFTREELDGEATDIAIMVETNDTSQQPVLRILTECLDMEASCFLTRKRKQTVRYVYVTVSFGQTINVKNLTEVGGDSFMNKDQNPYLADIVLTLRSPYTAWCMNKRTSQTLHTGEWPFLRLSQTKRKTREVITPYFGTPGKVRNFF